MSASNVDEEGSQDAGGEGAASVESSSQNVGSGGGRKAASHNEDEEEYEEEEEDEEEDEEEEEDDEEEEEEEQQRHGRQKRKASAGGGGGSSKGRNKKARSSARNFIDMEATVGDDDEEEEEEEDGDFLNEADEAHLAERELNLSQRRRLEQSRGAFSSRPGEAFGGAGHLASAIGDLERRYQDQKFDEAGEDELEDGMAEYTSYGGVEDDPTRFIPDSTDAKLWIVKTSRSSTEREAVIGILGKCLALRQKGIDFPILSAFAADGISGHIYVEGENPGKIQDALRGLRNVSLGAPIRMVPMREMCSVFLMGEKKVKTLNRNEWVRAKSGLYAGDLGQVVSHDTQTNVVTVRFIPRVDFNEAAERQRSGKKRPPQTTPAKRPLPRFFDREEVENKGGECEPAVTRGILKFDGKLFEESGYILRKIRAHLLATGDDARATAQEVKTFASGRLGDSTDNDGSASSNSLLFNLPPLAARREAYSVGEVVAIRAGDLIGLKAKIVSIDNKIVTLQPLDSRLSFNNVTVPLSDIIKHFDVGASVRATSGAHVGNSGLVTAIDLAKRSASVFSPSLGCPFTALLEELQICGESGIGSGGMNFLGGFAVGDLVQLSGQEAGVIVRIDSNKILSVLTTNGQTEQVSLSRIATKRSSEFVSALDCNRNPFGVRTPINILTGPYKGQSGCVCHIWKQKVFVKLCGGGEGADGGIVLCEGRQLRVGGQHEASSGGGGSGGAGSGGIPSGGGPGGDGGGGGGDRFRGGRGGFSGGGRGRGRGRGLDGQLVKIIGGRMKGVNATILHVNDHERKVRVHILNSGRQLTVDREDVIIISDSHPGGRGGRGGGYRGRGGDRFGGNTNSRPAVEETWGSYFDQTASAS